MDASRRRAGFRAFAAGRAAARFRRVRCRGVRYAGFWVRLLAYVIDVIVLEVFAAIAGAVLGIALAMAGVLGKFQPPVSGEPLPPSYMVLLWIVGLVVTIGYNVYFNSGTWQATPASVCSAFIS